MKDRKNIKSDTCVSFGFMLRPTFFHVSVWIIFGVVSEGISNTLKGAVCPTNM